MPAIQEMTAITCSALIHSYMVGMFHRRRRAFRAFSKIPMVDLR
jgi:hypothetical protein